MSDDSFSSHLPAVLASTTATLIATFSLSFLGVAGTAVGLVGGSLLTGAGAWWVERWYRKTAAIARAKREAIKRRGRTLTDTETQMIERVAEAKHSRIRGFPWKLAGACAGVTMLAATAAILFIELGTGKPVAAVVQNKPAHGLFVPDPAPTVTITAQPTRRHRPAPVFSTLDPSPSPVSVSTSPATTPPVTTAPPVTPTPSASSATPTPSSQVSQPQSPGQS